MFNYMMSITKISYVCFHLNHYKLSSLPLYRTDINNDSLIFHFIGLQTSLTFHASSFMLHFYHGDSRLNSKIAGEYT